MPAEKMDLLVVSNCLLKGASLVALSLNWEDPLEEGTEPSSDIFAWRIPMDRGA